MKCPHCSVGIHSSYNQSAINSSSPVGFEGRFPTTWSIFHMQCPACGKAILLLKKHDGVRNPEMLIYPRGVGVRTAPVEVPAELSEDFNEAAEVMSISTKASSALSRRCLQGLLRDQGYKQKDLAPAIQALIDAKLLPGPLANNLDAIRVIGNFAAHPMKDTQSGSIVPVEPEEAEWNLEVLEGLFDFFYVQPARDAARIAALNAKLQAAGKPPIKAPTP